MRGQRIVHLLLGLAVVLLLVIILYPSEREPQVPAAIGAPLARGAGAAVIAIERVSARDTLRLVRDGGQWYLRAPLEDLGSLRMARELLRALEELTILRFIPTDSLAAYGLAPPRTRLRLLSHGGETLEVSVGGYAPASGAGYLTWDGVPGVVLTTPRFMARFLEVDLFEWREREILPPTRAAIDSVWIEWPAETARLRRLDREEWVFLEPAGVDADGLSCERTVAAFWRFSFTRFLDDPVEARAAGLDPPQATWKIYRAGRCDTLRMGTRHGDGEMVMQLAGRVPGLVRDDLYTNLTGGIQALEARRLLWVAPHAVRTLVLMGEGVGACLVQRGANWYARALTAQEQEAVLAGGPLDAAADSLAIHRDASLAGDLINLLSLQAPRWLDPLATPATAADFPLQIHIWDPAGRHHWAGLARPGEGTAAAAVGARHPRRPLELPRELYTRWAARRDRIADR